VLAAKSTKGRHFGRKSVAHKSQFHPRVQADERRPMPGQKIYLSFFQKMCLSIHIPPH
jgi:hypothetical protein